LAEPNRGRAELGKLEIEDAVVGEHGPGAQRVSFAEVEGYNNTLESELVQGALHAVDTA
jgi:hypothetical protein